MKGILSGSFVLVSKNPISMKYASKFIGEIVQNKVAFNLYEAMYLIEKEELEVEYNGKLLTKEEFIKIATQIDPKFIEKFIVYKDLKERGYYVGAGLKFGSDFRVYPKGYVPGKGPREHSKWVCWVFRQNEAIDFEVLAAIVRTAHSTRKKVLIAVVDNEGDVTYYEMDWVKL